MTTKTNYSWIAVVDNPPRMGEGARDIMKGSPRDPSNPTINT